jgi:hypothetical protein
MRLIIVSNRLPFTVGLRDGEPAYKVTSGGFTKGLWHSLQLAGRVPSGAQHS